MHVLCRVLVRLLVKSDTDPVARTDRAHLFEKRIHFKHAPRGGDWITDGPIHSQIGSITHLLPGDSLFAAMKGLDLTDEALFEQQLTTMSANGWNDIT